MFNWILGNKKETFSESMINSFCQDLGNLAVGLVPQAKGQLEQYLLESKTGFINGLTDILEENKNIDQSELTKENTKKFFNGLKQQFLSYLDHDKIIQQNHPHFSEQIDNLINNQHKMIALSCDITTANLKNYQAKVARAEKWLSFFGKEKKTIKILIIGATQKGKTSLACLISGVDKKDLKKDEKDAQDQTRRFGLTSDTSEIKQFILNRNGVELIWVDTPGWWDSRGEEQNQTNKDLIEDYIAQNKDIDVVMFVAKLGDTLDGNLQKSISDFGKKCEKHIWDKSVIVLTNALSVSPPTEYMEIAQEELYPDDMEIYSDLSKIAEIKLSAWTRFTRASSDLWQNYFCEKYNENGVQDNHLIPVCLVEMSKFQLPLENNLPKYILYDGTPFLQELMYQILMLVDRKKSPIAFLAMANETTETTSHNTNLNNAADKMLNKQSQPSSEGSWCLLL